MLHYVSNLDVPRSVFIYRVWKAIKHTAIAYSFLGIRLGLELSIRASLQEVSKPPILDKNTLIETLPFANRVPQQVSGVNIL